MLAVVIYVFDLVKHTRNNHFSLTFCVVKIYSYCWTFCGAIKNIPCRVRVIRTQTLAQEIPNFIGIYPFIILFIFSWQIIWIKFIETFLNQQLLKFHKIFPPLLILQHKEIISDGCWSIFYSLPPTFPYVIM